MSLSEPGKTRPRKMTSSVSSKTSLHSNTSPVTSPVMSGRRRQIGSSSSSSGQIAAVQSHGRSKSDVTAPISLSAESSSVTTLPALRRGEQSSSGKNSFLLRSLSNANRTPCEISGSHSQSSKSSSHNKTVKSGKARISRTVSRDEDAEQSQVSSV